MKAALLLLAAGCAAAPINANPEASCRSQYFSIPEGQVVVMQYIVDVDGQAGTFVVKNADAHPDAVEAVKVYLSHCNFTPAYRNGKPVKALMTRTFRSQ